MTAHSMLLCRRPAHGAPQRDPSARRAAYERGAAEGDEETDGRRQNRRPRRRTLICALQLGGGDDKSQCEDANAERAYQEAHRGRQISLGHSTRRSITRTSTGIARSDKHTVLTGENHNSLSVSSGPDHFTSSDWYYWRSNTTLYFSVGALVGVPSIVRVLPSADTE
jgi:hypothetical protein